MLDTLLLDSDLKHWYPALKQARFEQLAIRCEVSFSHPNMDQVIKSLNDSSPANTDDLETNMPAGMSCCLASFQELLCKALGNHDCSQLKSASFSQLACSPASCFSLL